MGKTFLLLVCIRMYPYVSRMYPYVGHMPGGGGGGGGNSHMEQTGTLVGNFEFNP